MAQRNIDWVQLSDSAIITQIGEFVKATRLQQNMTQAKLAEITRLNRATISQLESGVSTNLMSLIQILRALDILYVLNQFEVIDRISPLQYVKLKKNQRTRARSTNTKETEQNDLGW